MSLPNELLDSIFEYVYSSLCIHRAQSEPDFPTRAKLVFSRISLVSKTWHSLSLPFLVRHFDGEHVEAFTEFLERYQLFRSVKTMHLNPEFKGWPNSADYEEEVLERWRAENSREIWEDDLVEACEADAAVDHENELADELHRWSIVINKCVPHLLELEIGSRRRNKLERCLSYGDNPRSIYAPYGSAPSLDLEAFLQALPGSRKLRSLRLNLPDEEQSHASSSNAQFAGAISSHFPNLANYTLHSHSTLLLSERSTPVFFPPLLSLRLSNFILNSSGFKGNLRPTYLAPSAASLRHLELIASECAAFPLLTDLFDSLRFPLLEKLHLDIPDLSCTQSDFFDRFPCIQTACIPLDPAQTHTNTLPLLPPSLTTLTLIGLDDSSLTPIANHLRRQDLSQLTRLVLQSTSDVHLAQPERSLPDFETSETPTNELAALIQICSGNEVELCFPMAIADETTDATNEEEEDLSEDERFDWDAEDGEEFRSLWSEEKKHSQDIDQAFAKIRYMMKNDEALEKAKEAIKPFLR